MLLNKWLNENTTSSSNSSTENNIFENIVNTTNTSTLDLCLCIHKVYQMCEASPYSKKLNYLYGNKKNIFHGDHNNDIGAVIYTIAIILMFSSVILMLMFRSIKRSKETIEIENLLYTMRYREEFEYYKRQKRRLQKAKNKVTAWLNKNNDKMWASSAHIIGSHSYGDSCYDSRKDSKMSSASFIPNIVISPTNDELFPRNLPRKSPSLSLIYNFDPSFSTSLGSNYSLSIQENVNTVDDI
uniref:Plasmodium vivax Vir protein n=1 Tax=Strongyloides papillosus TaxID=174720 RepID=A0A0N5BIF7_STREA